MMQFFELVFDTLSEEGGGGGGGVERVIKEGVYLVL